MTLACCAAAPGASIPTGAAPPTAATMRLPAATAAAVAGCFCACTSSPCVPAAPTLCLSPSEGTRGQNEQPENGAFREERGGGGGSLAPGRVGGESFFPGKIVRGPGGVGWAKANRPAGSFFRRGQ